MRQSRQVRMIGSVTVLAGLAAACEIEKSRNPLSPQVAGPIAGVTISAPRAVEPAHGSELVNSQQPVALVFENASTTGERPLWHQLQVALDTQFSSLVYSKEKLDLGPNGRTEHRLSDALQAGRSYYWRVRASDGANTGPFSDVSFFNVIVPVVVETPVPVEPIGGTTIATNSPEFVVANRGVSGPAGPVSYRFHVANDQAFADMVAVVTVPRSAGERTTMTLGTLPYDRLFFWRVNAGDGTVTSAWSSVQAFRTPSPPPPPPPPPPAPAPTPAPAPAPGPAPTPGPSPAPSGSGPRTPDPPPGQRLPLPDMFHVVQQVARDYPGALASSCQEHGGNWDFMDLVVDELRRYDTRWGYNGKRGNTNDPSQDVVDYHYGPGPDEGSTEVYIIDIINGHCGPNPSPAWGDQTGATAQAGTIGRWTGRGRF